jgi:hypothetical protein
MPWQRYVVDVALEVDEHTGIPFYDAVVLVVMRQNGKTELLLPVMTHRAIGFERFGPQTILYTTQTGSKAREKWEDIHIKRLEASTFKSMFTTRLRINQEAIMWVNGSMWSPAAGTKKTAGTGDSLDFGSIDEAWAADKGRELSMRPAMLTRPSKQLWITSMVPGLARAGTQDSQFLRDKMKEGIAMCRNDVRHGVAFFYFGLPMKEWQPGDDPADPLNWTGPATDPSDPVNWHRSMPALCPNEDPRLPCSCDPEKKWRHTITVQAIRSDFRSMDLIDFCAEYLSQWPKDNRPTWTLVKEAIWNDLGDVNSQPARGVAVGIDVDEDRTRAYIAVAGRRRDGHWHTEIIAPNGDDIPDEIEGLDWVVPYMAGVAERNDVVSVVIDPRGPAQSLILPLENLGITVLKPNTLEISAACARWEDAIHGREDNPVQAKHLEQPVLSQAVAYARKMISAKNRTFAWDRIGGAVSIAPLYAVTLAMHGYEAEMDEDYDVLESVLGLDGECADCGKYPDYEGGPIQHYFDCLIAYPDRDKKKKEDQA